LIAGLLTAANLLCGVAALGLTTVPAYLGWPGPWVPTAVWLIVLAGIVDAVDGPVARRLGSGRMTWGAEFDALADIVSFAVAPAVLVVAASPPSALPVVLPAAGIFVLAGAWRLARFLRTGPGVGRGRFAGMPVTGAGLLVAAWWLFTRELDQEGLFPAGAVGAMSVTALLMVSRLPYDKFPELGGWGRREQVKRVISALAVTAIAVRPALVGLPVALLYTLSGPVAALLGRQRAPGGEAVMEQMKGGPDEP